MANRPIANLGVVLAISGAIAFILGTVGVLSTSYAQRVADSSTFHAFRSVSNVGILLLVMGVICIVIGYALPSEIGQISPPGQTSAPKGMKINLVCLIGVIIGLVGVFMSWASGPAESGLEDFDLTDVLRYASQGTLGYKSAILFVVGTVIGLVSPVGFTAQLSGLAAYLVWFADSTEGVSGVNLGIGFYLGLVSALVVLVSLVRPYGPGLTRGPFGLKQRLITLSR